MIPRTSPSEAPSNWNFNRFGGYWLPMVAGSMANSHDSALQLRYVSLIVFQIGRLPVYCQFYGCFLLVTSRKNSMNKGLSLINFDLPTFKKIEREKGKQLLTPSYPKCSHVLLNVFRSQSTDFDSWCSNCQVVSNIVSQFYYQMVGWLMADSYFS